MALVLHKSALQAHLLTLTIFVVISWSMQVESGHSFSTTSQAAAEGSNNEQHRNVQKFQQSRKK